MKCPNCDHRNHLEIDLHADGFSTDLLECGECGVLLTANGLELEIVRKPSMEFITDKALC